MSGSLISRFGVSAKTVRRVAKSGLLYVAVPVQPDESYVPELQCPDEVRAAYMGLKDIQVFAPGASESNEGLNSMIGTIGCRSNDREQLGICVVCHLFFVSGFSTPTLSRLHVDDTPSQDDYQQGNVVWAKICQ